MADQVSEPKEVGYGPEVVKARMEEFLRKAIDAGVVGEVKRLEVPLAPPTKQPKAPVLDELRRIHMMPQGEEKDKSLQRIGEIVAGQADKKYSEIVLPEKITGGVVIKSDE